MSWIEDGSLVQLLSFVKFVIPEVHIPHTQKCSHTTYTHTLSHYTHTTLPHTHVHTPTPDTEGSFIVQRVADIANAAVLHLSGVSDASGDPGNNSWMVIKQAGLTRWLTAGIETGIIFMFMIYPTAFQTEQMLL